LEYTVEEGNQQEVCAILSPPTTGGVTELENAVQVTVTSSNVNAIGMFAAYEIPDNINTMDMFAAYEIPDNINTMDMIATYEIPDNINAMGIFAAYEISSCWFLTVYLDISWSERPSRCKHLPQICTVLWGCLSNPALPLSKCPPIPGLLG